MTPYDGLLRYPDRSRPLITWYGGPDVRMELSVASTLNAVAKAGGMLRDGLGLEPGAIVSVDLPRHWQLPVWVMAGLSVGAHVGRVLSDGVQVRVVGPDALESGGAGDAQDVLASSCDVFGMPFPRGVPAGVVDIAAEVRGYPDSFTADPGSAQAAVLVDGVGRPWQRRRAGIPDGTRIWVDDETPDADLMDLAAIQPLLVQGSVVIATGLDPTRAEAVRRTESAAAVP